MTAERLQDLPILFDYLALKERPQAVQQMIATVDSVLPQTQCGLCDHPDGCLPYAVAIVVNNEPHNKCVPGGQPVSDTIAQILQRPTLTARASAWPIDSVTKRPTEVRAVIREDDCIGCTKCIPACPVDAIIGTGKHMHTIITDLCTGCELCLPPCPVDCIDLIQMPNLAPDTLDDRQAEQAHLRRRYHTHLNHVATQMLDNTSDKPVTSMIETKIGNAANKGLDISAAEAKATIEAAKLRTKIKKLEKQLAVREHTQKRAELQTLKQQLAEFE